MNKIMKITLAASAMLAMSLTIGCSDDKESDKYCIVTYAIGEVEPVCYNLDKSFNEKACKAMNVEGLYTAKTASKAPDGVKCTDYGVVAGE